MPVESVRDIHRRAMDLADQADAAKHREQDTRKANRLYREAFTEEVRAILRFLAQTRNMTPEEIEPTRSILCRSAGTLALLCNLNSLALHYARLGLSGAPPADVREELDDVMRQAKERLGR